MSEETSKLHPDVQKFKSFVLKHPHLIQRVRSGDVTWNDIYQDWVILGEDHDEWKTYRTEDDSSTQNPSEAGGSSNPTGNSEQMDGLMKLLSQINIQDLQHHISQFNGAMGNVQRLLQQFQGNSSPPPHRDGHQEDPFMFRGF
ncbi:YlbD family protein [Salsuginibacillus kocurii]|uniref:YlbD family protein n=1 Tax=Salsuginibacillus kocurii TaxID=427078 RepID=UPI0003654500|nr:YlbD family protein [Salsuginibacillus kocurii]